MVAADLEDNESLGLLIAESEEEWSPPLVRMIFQYKDDECSNPDDTLDPIQGWIDSPPGSGFLAESATENEP
ncbi:hypothetical protein ACT3SZ_05760 [Corynebacterium sp. AOP40-9SA-29]|uniref:hypothetical protein n=1 Tax=Corynebacterium sp. AOP40-9SA-29 TaxID=3457677 RepID=UPI0040344851